MEECARLDSPCPLLCTAQELISRRLTVAQGDVERLGMCGARVRACQRGEGESLIFYKNRKDIQLLFADISFLQSV